MSDDRRPVLANATQEPWWLVPLVIALMSRAFGSLLVVAVGRTAWPLFTDPPALGPATMWDGAWYLEIARFGYHAGPIAQGPAGGYVDFAFWPAWPALLGAALRVVPLPADLVAGLLANGLSVVAIVLWARVLERAFDRSIAMYAIAFVAFSPSAFVLSMGYSEPLFLVLGALFFLSSEAGWARPLLGAVAQAARLTGLALGAAALPILWRSRGRDAMARLTVMAPAMVFVAWWILIAVLTGDPGGYLKGTPSWAASTGAIGGPLSLLIALKVNSAYLVPIAISASFAVVIGAGIVVLARQHRWDLAWYAAATAIPSLALASWEWMPRHLLVAVPAFGATMGALSVRRRRQLLMLSIGAEAAYGLFVLSGRFAP